MEIKIDSLIPFELLKPILSMYSLSLIKTEKLFCLKITSRFI